MNKEDTLTQSTDGLIFADKILRFLLKHKSLFTILALIITYIITTPYEKIETALEILDDAITTWLSTLLEIINTKIVNEATGLESTYDLYGFSLELINLGFKGFFNFIIVGLSFYSKLFILDFTIITEIGFLLALIYICTPLIGLLLISFLFIKKEKVIISIKKLITPRFLFLIFFLLPITPELLVLCIPIFIFLLGYHLYEIIRIKALKEKLSVMTFPWIRTSIYLLISALLLMGLIIGPEKATPQNLKPIMVVIMILFLIFLIIIKYIQYKRILPEKHLKIILKIWKDYNKPINLFFTILILLILIPISDILLFQTPILSLAFIIFNFPWIISPLFFDPQELVRIILNGMITNTFNILLDASRVILSKIISIEGASLISGFQPSTYRSFFLITLFLILIIAFGIISRYKNRKKTIWLLTDKIYLILQLLLISSFLVLVIMYIFPKYSIHWGGIMYDLFNYSIHWDGFFSLGNLPFLFVFFTFIAAITVVIIISVRYLNHSSVNIEMKPFTLMMIGTMIITIVSFILDPSNFLEFFGDIYRIDTSLNLFEFNLSSDELLILLVLLIILALVVFVVQWFLFQVKKGRSKRILVSTIFINTLVIGIAIIMIIPFVWMVKTSFQTNLQNSADFQQQGLAPAPFYLGNYARLFGLNPPAYSTLSYKVITWMLNSVIAAVSVTAFLVIFSAMAGYCFAKRDFIGKKLLFAITIAILMVPPYVQVIPLYLELSRLGFFGSLLGVILPFLIQPFSVFLCTEFMKNIPDDYLDAARIDGYSEFQIFWKVVLPLSTPVLSVMIIINLIGNWNAFLWPLLLIESSPAAIALRTMPLGMYAINAQLEEQVGVILGMATIIVIPIFTILFLMQDYIKKGVTVEGLKG